MFLIRNFARIRSAVPGSARIASRIPRRPLGDLRLGVGEALLGVGRGRVDDRPRRQHDRQRAQGLVGVLDGPAAHAAGVVGHDPADGGRGLRRRIRPEPVAVRLQGRIRPGQDRARLAAQRPTAVLDGAPDPVAHHLDEDPVALGLPGQAGAGGAERDRDRVGVPVGQDWLDVVDVAGQDDDLREHPVRAGVGGEPDEVEPAAEHEAGVAEQLLEVGAQPGRRAGGEVIRRPVGRGHRILGPVGVRGRLEQLAHGQQAFTQRGHVHVLATVGRCPVASRAARR